jgi:type II secretory pathway pseudopilin PulG
VIVVVKVGNSSGFTYLAVMFSIVLIGLSLTGAVQQWKTIMQREKEAELLFRGDQIKDAVERYYRAPRAGTNQYPRSLEELLKDPGSSATKRYLRKLYKDPITNDDWVLVKDGAGRVKGVHSRSPAEPIKKANFTDEYKGFEGKTKYSDWVFEFTPGAPTPPVGAQPAVQGGVTK